MSVIVTTVVTALSAYLGKIVVNGLGAIKETFKYLNGKRKDKKEKEQKQQKADYDKKADTVADSGTIDDLLDLRK